MSLARQGLNQETPCITQLGTRWDQNRYAASTARGRLWGLFADRNLLLGRPRLEVVGTPSAGPHCVSRCSCLLGIATVIVSLVPQFVSRGSWWESRGGSMFGTTGEGKDARGVAEHRPGTESRRACTDGGRGPAPGDGGCGPQLRHLRLPAGRGRRPGHSPQWDRILSMTLRRSRLLPRLKRLRMKPAHEVRRWRSLELHPFIGCRVEHA